MAQSSIVSVLTISFPEAIAIILLGLLSTGKSEYIRSKINLARVLAMAALSSVMSFFIRKLVGSEIENLLVSFIMFTLLYIFIIKLTVYESTMASLLSLVLFTIEQTACILLLTAITGLNFENVLSNDITLFLFFIPERIVEAVLIYIFMKYNIKIIDFEKVNLKKKEFYLQLFVYIISICTLIFITNLLAKLAIYGDLDAINNSTNSILVRINIYLTIFVTIVLTIAIKSTNDYYKNKNSLSNNELKQSLKYISNLLEEKNYEELKDALDKLNDHISKQ
ncbi:hypothetical protein CDQ84_09690 [Clostridium thermosuccinogenes]|uniref:Uncharacterized protein n=1 Tax=Clostridium thermosuccinogenes TaxID=84032 RepID=A0A2K2FJQ4_9CLOT|nr:hypothetical protein [Pseudoclostridium thermosuccinogenes]AUS98473.1 hypothetical protein CDO33_19645 [Pseudoclostridium thermosuccinogenes]PNT97074.1 hypothetical protein CDQ85_09540 [Pseudoclostridium thermosuccinogenes]PNT99005.1 hypothetical protein CDQ84_09690 [Pseudoclostridium thermosuccinogenes]